MKRLGCLIGGILMAALALPASAQAPPPELQALNVSLGQWEFHGTSKSRSGKTGTWTWKEDCRWSPNHMYLECTFSNVWSGRPAESLVVDTYNTADHSYWHYELFSAGDNGAHPFAAKMDIQDNTWTEYGAQAIPGKQRGERIVYHWGSPGHVAVAIETSTDGMHWTAVDQGTGVRTDPQR